jgi:hypothetical protein
MTARQLANKLRPYAIHPKPLKISGVTYKGYSLSDFADCFERYISSPAGGILSVTQLQTANNAESPVFLSVTEGSKVTDEKSLFSAFDEGSNRVTDRTGGIPEKEENGVVEVEI